MHHKPGNRLFPLACKTPVWGCVMAGWLCLFLLTGDLWFDHAMPLSTLLAAPPEGFGEQSPTMRNFIGPEGHFSIEVIEDSLPKLKNLLPFSVLAAWNFDPEKPQALVPETIAQFHGQNLAMVGFVFPLEDGDSIRAFLLTASTQTCCFGPRPQFNQYLLVESSSKFSFEQGKPVLISGKFFVEPNPKDGYIFRMEASTVEKAPEKTLAKLSEAETATLVSLPRLSWEAIENLQNLPAPPMGQEKNAFPASITDLIGKPLIAEGQLIAASTTNGVTFITLAKNVWDGCCTGVFPNSYNAVSVFLASDCPPPPPWIKSAVVVGTFRKNEFEERAVYRLFSLHNSQFLDWSHKATGTAQVEAFFLPPVIMAANRSDLALTKLLIRGGASLNDRNKEGLTALHIASLLGSVEICRELLVANAPVNPLCQFHQTPLHKAAANGRTAIVELLASAGADLNPKDKEGMTPLTVAMKNFFTETAKWLIEHGADLKAVNAQQQTLLHIAVVNQNFDLIKLLLDRGVPKSTRDAQGHTPLDISRGQRKPRMADLLKTLGVTE